MLTFLRKIRKTLIESGHVRTYLHYAIGEILLVMIGILLALQVNNWNEASKNRGLEKVLMKEINQEFKYNLSEFEGNLNRYNAVRRSLRQIINDFPIDPQLVDLDTLAQAFERIHFQGNYDRSLTAISKIKSTSSLDIISNDELRSLLIDWEVMESDYQIDERRAIQFHMEQFAPLMYKRFSRPYATGLKDPRVDLNYLRSLEFEGLIRFKLGQVNNLFRALNGEPNIVTVMERIIEITEGE